MAKSNEKARQEYARKHVKELERTGLIYDPKTGRFVIDESRYMSGAKKTKKKTTAPKKKA